MGKKKRGRGKQPAAAPVQGAEEQPAAAAPVQRAQEQPAAAAPVQGAEQQPAAAASVQGSMPEVTFMVKTVEFCGDSRIVIFPPVNHRSAFVALVNALLLKGSLSPGTINSQQTPNAHFILRMIRRYSRLLKNLKMPIPQDQISDTLKRLSQNIDISINFTRIDGIMSKTVAFDIFQHMGISLYHLQIIDPQDIVVALAVGDDFHEIFSALYPDELPVPIPNADQPVLDFIQGTGLTAFGLQELSKAMENDQISVVFWNKTFHTVLKHEDGLYALQNDLQFFKGNALWKKMNVGADIQLCSSNFLPVSIMPTTHVQDEQELACESLPEYRESSEFAATRAQLQKHKCIRPDCSLKFFSALNLNRHNQVHKKDRAAKMEFLNTTNIAQFWDQLSAEERSGLLSLKSAPAIKGINGALIYRCLEKVGPDGVFCSIANKLKHIIDSAEKAPWDALFAVLVEASEKTAFSMDIRHCPHSNMFLSGLRLLREVPDILACYSYFLEQSLVERWLEYKADEALQHASFFLDEKTDGRLCGINNCTLCFNSEINFNRHKSVHATDLDPKEDFLLNRDEIGIFWDNLNNLEAAQLLSYHDMIVQSFRGKKLAEQLEKLVQNSTVTDTTKCLQTMLTSSRKPTSNELFDVLDKVSEETLFCTDVRKCKENVIFGDSTALTSTSNVLACISYMLEKKLVYGWSDLKAGKVKESEKHEKSVESKEDSVESNPESQEDSGHKSDSSDSSGMDNEYIFQRIPFEKYARKHKFTRVYKLRPKWMFQLFHKHLKKLNKAFKLHLNILTRKGRKCARGFLRYIIKMHMRKKCWSGDWDLSDMEIRNGEFIISKEALLDLTAERVAEDLKRFIELVLKPHYYNKHLQSFPLYFNEFQDDVLHVPDPKSNWSEFLNFEKYLALHFAFMPPLSRSTLLIHLYKAIESVRYEPVNHFKPLCHMPKMDWRTHIKGLPFIADLYYYGIVESATPNLDPYGPAYFYLLKFCRHFGSHDTDHTKLAFGQQLDDVIISDLMLGQLLSRNITQLILEIVKWTHMEGRYLQIFQAFEASDDEVVFCIENECDDDISEESSSSSDDEI